MAWVPQRAYFAVIALIGSVAERAARAAAGRPPLVMLTGDDLGKLLAQRQTLKALRPGCALQVVWGHTGEAVTVDQLHQLIGERAPAAGTVRPDGHPALGPLDRLSPLNPRLLKPDAWPTPRPEPRRLPPLEGEAGPAICRDCETRRRNLVVAELTAPCDSLGSHAPNQSPAPPAPDSSHF